jgi:hypothetical protein
LVFFQNPFENHRDINLDTHRHRLTDRSQTDWPASVGRNYTEAVCPTVRASSPIQILSVRPSDCPGRFCRWIKTQNRRVRRTEARTDVVNLYIRCN